MADWDRVINGYREFWQLFSMLSKLGVYDAHFEIWEVSYYMQRINK